jgi:hypothetical protein
MVAAPLAGALLSGAAVWIARQPAIAPSPPVQFQIAPPEAVRYGNFFALSPDARHLAFGGRDAQGRNGLWLHAFATGRSSRLDRAGVLAASLFWSPDSRFIGYVSAGRLQRIETTGTPPQEIAPVEAFGGAAWTVDDTILYGQMRGALRRVPAAGGEPVAVTELDASRGDVGHTNPVMLPDGRRFLYLRISRIAGNSGIFTGSLDSSPERQPKDPLLPLDTQAAFSAGPNGESHLLYVRDRTLMAHAFDLPSLTLRGTPVAIADGVSLAPTNYVQIAVAGDTLAFRPPDPPAGGIPTWIGRDGRVLGPVISPPTPVTHVQLAPDGKGLAAIVEFSLWVYSLEGRPPLRLTTGSTLSPLWSPDGQHIVAELFGATVGLHAMAADGSSSAPQQVSPAAHYHAFGFTDDGRQLLAGVEQPAARQQPTFALQRLPFPGPSPPSPIAAIVLPDASASAALSPDGRWLAYIANATGTAELWVRRYPALDAPVRVSPNGAAEPVWAKNGRELFYLEGDKLMSATVRPSSSRFDFEVPVMLVEKSFMRSGQPPSYDVAGDGRFVLLQPTAAAASAPIEVIVNWRSRMNADASR